MAVVAITGGAGFIGCRLADRLSAQGHEVFAIDVLHPQVHPERCVPADFPTSCRFFPLDVTHPDPWEPLLKQTRPDVVVHLAAETGTGQSLSEASRHASVNVLGTTRMLDALYRLDHRPSHIVLASSRAVYGDGAWQANDGAVKYPGVRRSNDLRDCRWDYYNHDGSPMVPLPSVAGLTQTLPTNIYAATKLAQEHILRAWCAATETALSVLRLQNVYGPGQSISNSYTGVLTFMAREALSGGVIDVFEDGEIIRDFVFVDDVVNALATASNSVPETLRILDIGSGLATTIANAASLVASAAGAPSPVVSGHYREGDVRAASCSIDAAREELGYSPTISIGEGVSRLVAWMAADLR
jgi:dTDP-L-rhamnose 4-epimerase